MTDQSQRTFSLRTKLLIAVLAVFACLLAVMSGIQYYSGKAQLVEAMRTYTTYVNRIIEVNVKNALLRGSPEEIRQSLDYLAASRGNQIQAARLLKISRDTLRYRMKKFNIPSTREPRT